MAEIGWRKNTAREDIGVWHEAAFAAPLQHQDLG